MSTQQFLSEICLFSFNFPPKGWALCNGQVLAISQNTALFSLLGTTYGGNGITTFALPNLQGRVPMDVGGGHTLGEQGGSESAPLDQTFMPAHSHAITVPATARCKNGPANAVTPAGNVPAIEASRPTYGGAGSVDAMPNMSAGAIVLGGGITEGDTGLDQPHGNMQPYLTVSYCIALQGIFPSQN